jgi:hypothetical protein
MPKRKRSSAYRRSSPRVDPNVKMIANTTKAVAGIGMGYMAIGSMMSVGTGLLGAFKP